ncbi:hypothetical protein WI37_31765 [Burkholderia ubonensis]|nr:hypothetical protein WI37_31765 [Burkholderia ubonensis]
MTATANEIAGAMRAGRSHRSASPPVRSAAGIAKRFDATVALSASNLSIDAGEVVALTMLTSMFNPLRPIALLWFGLGTGSLLFVLVHAVLWPLALGMCTSFAGVPASSNISCSIRSNA